MIDASKLVSACESLRAYVMVHGGVDRHDRMLDIDMIEVALGLKKPGGAETAESGGSGWQSSRRGS